MMTPAAGATARCPVVQRLYGIRIRTPWPVPGLEILEGPWDVEFVEGDPPVLERAASSVPVAQRDRWAQSGALPDGSNYRRWSGLFEFLVTPDARRIHARVDQDVPDEALLAYLLVDALSFSMIRMGWEPLHATAVHTAHGVAAFLGDSGRGKSTLAALCVKAGARLLTDDMLILIPDGGRFLAQPGPPRLKLYRDMARRIFGTASEGVPMNSVTDKVILPLTARQSTASAAPLAALYVLDAAPADSAPIAIRRLTPACALPAALAGTAGHFPSDPDRLTRQFRFVTDLVRHVPVLRLTYRRDPAEMARVRDAVLADLEALAS